MISDIGEKGVRDPYIIKDVHGRGYYLIATDLRIATGKGWADSVSNGSKSFVLWKSKDFETFTKAKKYIERDNHVIDTTIVEHKGMYYRFSKNETTKYVEVDRADDLESDNFETVKCDALASLMGVEGPEIYALPEEGKWCLIVDRFLEGKGYLPLISDNLESGDFRILDESMYDMGNNRKRHGGVIKLDGEEYARLKEKLL